jgi:hypothetical protein
MIPIANRLSLKLAIAVAAALMLALLIHDRNRWKAKTAHYSELLAGERAAHSATVANYRAAAEQARRADAENAARVKAEQAAINERTSNDFESRLAAARARADRLRGQSATAEADSGSRGAAAVPGIPASAQGPSQASGEDGLPARDALIATEQAIQLDELIKWVRAQSEVGANAQSE